MSFEDFKHDSYTWRTYMPGSGINIACPLSSKQAVPVIVGCTTIAVCWLKSQVSNTTHKSTVKQRISKVKHA